MTIKIYDIERGEPRQIGWDVYLGNKWIDKVYFIPEMEEDEVKRSLINHDNYAPGIRVVPDRKSETWKI